MRDNVCELCEIMRDNVCEICEIMFVVVVVMFSPYFETRGLNVFSRADAISDKKNYYLLLTRELYKQASVSFHETADTFLSYAFT